MKVDVPLQDYALFLFSAFLKKSEEEKALERSLSENPKFFTDRIAAKAFFEHIGVACPTMIEDTESHEGLEDVTDWMVIIDASEDESLGIAVCGAAPREHGYNFFLATGDLVSGSGRELK